MVIILVKKHFKQILLKWLTIHYHEKSNNNDPLFQNENWNSNMLRGLIIFQVNEAVFWRNLFFFVSFIIHANMILSISTDSLFEQLSREVEVAYWVNMP